MPTPRGLTPAGRERVEAVARRHLDDGLHTGAQLAVYRDGELQVDLRIGSAAAPDARMLWFSATKPLAAVSVLMLAERGQLDLDAPIAALWPEFGAGGKQACTVRHVLTHRGGFPVFPWEYDWEHIDDWDAVCAVTAGIEAEWAPGEDTGYHPVTYGFALGEVIRRVDGRAPRDFLRDEVFEPLGMDASLGVEEARLRDVVAVEAMSEVTMLDPTGSERRTSDIVRRFRLPSTLRAQMPAANAIGTAEALARFYDAILDWRSPHDASPRPRLLSAETATQATTRQWRADFDRTFMLPASYGLGFLTGGVMEPYNEPGVFGHSGQQSTIGYADPGRGLAVAYLTNGLHGPLEVQMRYAEVALAIIAACEEADRAG